MNQRSDVPILKIRFSGNAFALVTKNHSAGVDVSAVTCVPAWDGESMDDDMVVRSWYR